MTRNVFLCPILVWLHSVQYRNHLTRVSIYQEHEHELNMSGIQYPVHIKDTGRFEHVYGYEDKKSSHHARRHVNLFYITTGEKPHYVLVKNLSTLVSIQYNNHKHKAWLYQ